MREKHTFVTIISSGLLVTALFLGGSVAVAEEGGTMTSPETTSARETVQQKRQDIKDIRTDRRETVKDELGNMRKDIKTIRETATSTPEMMRKEVKERRDEARDTVKTTREEARTAVKEKKQEIRSEVLKQRIVRAVRKIDHAIDRLEKAAERIGSRIEKFKAQGVDVGGAATLLEGAKGKITTAREKLSALEALRGETVTDPKAFLEKVKAATDGAVQAVKDAHAALVSVVTSLKPGLNRETAPATTSTVE